MFLTLRASDAPCPRIRFLSHTGLVLASSLKMNQLKRYIFVARAIFPALLTQLASKLNPYLYAFYIYMHILSRVFEEKTRSVAQSTYQICNYAGLLAARGSEESSRAET